MTALQQVTNTIRRWPALGMPPRGIVLFAFNNPTVDYGTIALCNAMCIKKNMKENHITLICDHATHEALMKTKADICRRVINNWVHTESPTNSSKSMRTIKDTSEHRHDMTWLNRGRQLVWELSPYQETLLIDSDYFILDNTLDHCWGSVEDIMINKVVLNIDNELLYDPREKINDVGIPLYWATAVYFNRSEKAETFFNLCHHIAENYEYYILTYRLPGRLYRNDYVFSIATHIMNDMIGDRNVIPSLPVPHILCSWDKDEFLGVDTFNNFRFLVCHENNNFSYTSVRNMNVHIMNKMSILRHTTDIIEMYGADYIQQETQKAITQVAPMTSKY